MCWKYENKYHGYCFDNFDQDITPASELMNLPDILSQYYGVKIVDFDQWAHELWALMDSWHERGIIKPMPDDEYKEVEKNVVLEPYESEGKTYYRISKNDLKFRGE